MRDDVLEALSLRAPSRMFLAPGVARPPGLFAVAELRQIDDEQIGVVVILSDGRLYRRTIDAAQDVAPRVAASALEQLLAGIEEDRFVPDERDVPLPAEATAPEPEPDPPEPDPPPPVLPAMPWPQMGIVGHGGIWIGVPPPEPAGFAGGGGGVDFFVRWPKGLLVGGGLSFGGHQRQDAAALRLSATLQAGYGLRRGAFELLMLAGPLAEPVFVRRNGAPEVLTFPDGSTRSIALGLGGQLTLAPGYRKELGDRAFRVGPRIQVRGTGLASGGVARLNTAAADGTREAVLRVGGLETVVGIEVGGWFTLGDDR